MIHVINIKTPEGKAKRREPGYTYIGRYMPNLTPKGSVLATPHSMKWKPGMDREEVLKEYRAWFWPQMIKEGSAIHREMHRLFQMAKTDDVYLGCWCAPELCHGHFIKAVIEYYLNIKPPKHTGYFPLWSMDDLKLIQQPVSPQMSIFELEEA